MIALNEWGGGLFGLCAKNALIVVAALLNVLFGGIAQVAILVAKEVTGGKKQDQFSSV